jgi:hypothetical protein
MGRKPLVTGDQPMWICRVGALFNKSARAREKSVRHGERSLWLLLEHSLGRYASVV